MKPLPLPPVEFLNECFSLNTETGELRWRERPTHHFGRNADYVTWNKKFAGKLSGKLIPNGYLQIAVQYGGESRRLYAHRVIFVLAHGRCPDEVDHVNGERADNRPGNLREATRQQNRRNMKSWRDLPKGVYRHKENYAARATIDRKVHHIGTFKTPEEAHAAFTTFVTPVYGEFFRAA